MTKTRTSATVRIVPPAAPSQVSCDIPLSLIVVSPTNPRRHFDEAKLSELRESIEKHGVLQPVLVRPIEHDRYELVAGERRFRATKAAGYETIPAVIRELDDKQALEVQVVENLQRTDLHPLEEAEGYASLIERHGYDAESLALKIGKSKSYVYGRLKLADLCDVAKEACYDGKLPHSHALEIARIPDERLQKQVLTKILEGFEYHGQARSFRELKRIVKADFQLHLKTAKFDTAAVIGTTNPCTICPHRSGNQADLFDDFDNADVCTLPTCFRAKEEYAWQESQAKNAKKGIKVLSLEQGRKMAAHGYFSSQSYVDLDSICYEDPERRKVKDLLPKDAPIAICRAANSAKTYKVVAKKDLAKALESAGVKTEKPRSRNMNAPENQRDWELGRKTEDAIANAIKAAVLLIEAPAKLEAVTAMVLRGVIFDFEFESFDGERDQVLAMSNRELLSVIATGYGPRPWAEDGVGRRQMFLAAIGVDEVAIKKQVRREFEGDKEEEPAKPQKKSKKKKTATAGVCTECGCTETTPCELGPNESCAWVDAEQTLCSGCEL